MYLQNNLADDYPREVIFQCTYECLNSKTSLDFVTATHKVLLYNQQQEATLTACQGVKVKKNSWGYEYAGTTSFYAHLIKNVELKKWAKKSGRNLQTEHKLKQNLIKTLTEIITAYKIASKSTDQFANTYQQASFLLENVIASLEAEDFRILDAYVREPRSIPPYFSANHLVTRVLQDIAHWRSESIDFYSL